MFQKKKKKKTKKSYTIVDSCSFLFLFYFIPVFQKKFLIHFPFTSFLAKTKTNKQNRKTKQNNTTNQYGRGERKGWFKIYFCTEEDEMKRMGWLYCFFLKKKAFWPDIEYRSFIPVGVQ